MATIYMNGFEWNTLNEGISDYHYAYIQGGSSSFLRSGNYGLTLNGLNLGWARCQFVSSTEIYFQVAIRFDSIPYVNNKIITWGYDSTVLGIATVNSSQLWTISVGSSIGTPVASGSSIVTMNRWVIIEVYVKLGGADSGAITLRMDGIDECSYLGNTIPGTVSQINAIQFQAPFVLTYIDDIIVNDTTGEFNKSWPNGDRIQLLRPVGKGMYTSWDQYADTGNYIDNYEFVDQNFTDTPPRFLYTDRVGDVDTYLMQDLPAGLTSVSVVRTDFWAARSGSVRQTATHAIKPPGITYHESYSCVLKMAYQLFSQIWQNNPTDGTAWTPESFAETECGIKLLTAVITTPVPQIDVVLTANSPVIFTNL